MKCGLKSHHDYQNVLIFGRSRCRYDLYLSLEESIFGGKHDIEVPYLENCEDCGGTGAKSSSCLKTCGECGGRGQKMETERTPFGIMSQVTPVK